MAICPTEERVDLRGERVAVAQRNVDEVAGNRDHRDRPADRIERDDHQRVGQGLGPGGARIDPHEEDVDPLAELRLRAGGRARIVLGAAGRVAAGPGEDALERREGVRAVEVGGEVGQRHQREDDDQADPAEPTGPAGIAPIGEGVEDREQPPAENEAVEDQQQLERSRHDRVSQEHRRAVQLDEQPNDGEDDERRDREDRGRPGAAVERLTEARQDGRQDGGEEAALVGRSGGGPGAAGVHDGGGVSWGSGARRRSAAGASLAPEGKARCGDAGRSISLPVTARRPTCDARPLPAVPRQRRPGGRTRNRDGAITTMSQHAEANVVHAHGGARDPARDERTACPAG